MKPYQKRCLNSFASLCDLSQRDILEIGGTPPFHVAQELIQRGAKTVTIIDYRPDLTNMKLTEKINFLNMDARYLKFEDNKFDFVFGTAVLEHLPDVERVLSEINRVLRKGGIVCLHGGPLWASCLGHHVFVHVDGIKYEFNGNNPIPDYYHLIYDKTEMKKYLMDAQHISHKAATAIVEFVYDSDKLNRLFYEDLVMAFNRTKEFAISNIIERVWKTPPSNQTLELIKNKPDHRAPMNVDRNYSISEMEVVLSKA